MSTWRSEIGVGHSIPSFGLGPNATDETHHSSFGRDCSGEVETVRFGVAREKWQMGNWRILGAEVAYTGIHGQSLDRSIHVMHPRTWFIQLQCIRWCSWYPRTSHTACFGNIYMVTYTALVETIGNVMCAYICRWCHTWFHNIQIQWSSISFNIGSYHVISFSSEMLASPRSRGLETIDPSDATCCKPTCSSISCPAGREVPPAKEPSLEGHWRLSLLFRVANVANCSALLLGLYGFVCFPSVLGQLNWHFLNSIDRS